MIFLRVQKVLNTKVKHNHVVNKICHDSRKVSNGDIFFAINGINHNGEDYIEEAIKNGAQTIVTECDCDLDDKVNIVVVNNVRKALATSLKRFYRKIFKRLTFIGITGTNGKTTTTTLIYQYLQYREFKACLIGSNGIFINHDCYDTINTTPDIGLIYEYAYEAYKQKCQYVIMEVSSHAIKQLRIFGIDYKVILLTNLTLDHLDYHHDFIDYQYTKGLLLHCAKDNSYVLINKDNEYYDFFNYISRGIVLTYGKNESDYWINNIELKEDESSFNLVFHNKSLRIKTNLLGLFNVYNVTSFIAVIDVLNLYHPSVLTFLKKKIVIPGRMEEVQYRERRIIVDFAHTPDGVFNVLNFLKEMKKRIILVVGCGGSRDKTKRSVIGQIAVDNSHYVIFTSDNPRDEDEMTIIKDIIVDIEKENYEIVLDRKAAIKRAISISEPNDIIAILGRGNEKYQKVKGELIPLNDMEVVKEIIQGE